MPMQPTNGKKPIHRHRKSKSFGIYDESWEPKIAKQIQERIHESQLLHATSQVEVEEHVNDIEVDFTPADGLLPPSITNEKKGDVSDDNSGFAIGGFAEDSIRSISFRQGSQQRMTLLRSTSIPAVDRPFMIALCGIPGSGKAISALVLANLLEGQGIGTMVMPHLGYHYPIDYLRSHFADPEDMIYRRGAPDTFDATAFVRDVLRVRGEYVPPEKHHASAESLARFVDKEPIIGIPGFDHARGDAEADVHTFDRNHHKVVICEGMYLMHDADGWEKLDGLFDLKIFIEESDIDIVMERLKIRNQCIPGYTPEEIIERVDKVDRVNASIVMKSKSRADIVVRNISKPIDQDERPEQRSALGLALSALDLTDFDRAELAAKDNKDWTMDIVSRPESNTNLLDYVPTSGRSRSNSMVSLRSNKSEPPPPAASFIGTWEEPQAEIILKRIKEWQAANPQEENTKRRPYMIAISATPGSGKSVSAFMLANFLENSGYPTMICPHDGYHYPLDYLRTFPDADDLVYRRGAPETFDSFALMRDLDRIRNGKEDIIKLPAFDHAKGDPEPETHIFDRNRHKIVLCEGLYLLHDQDGWEGVRDYFDYRIFMNADIDVCIERVKIRNQCIPGYTPEEIEIRCEKVDRINALTVLRSKYRADVVVESVATKK
ncbi:phosphoribulokinase / uridine kinase family protein [Nitzschia inconspicua]|uniref:Phosphoribulokinase / uridine kinase family protein n=1 Tax=Nitzschia inconspicua TaxID=303405 RepID=A0A9K3KTH5_9STRA|nr:phosphoribulokinase / uridine kinase family protein [Nitzschia inconspicua]